MKHPKKRQKAGRFAKLPLQVLESPAACSLSHGEFRVLVYYAAQYTGYNNGSLGITPEQAERLGISGATLKRARRKLVERGLIQRTKDGTRTPPRPNLYALTWCPIDEGKHDAMPTKTPTHAYREWRAKTDSDGSSRPTAVGHHDPRSNGKGPRLVALHGSP